MGRVVVGAVLGAVIGALLGSLAGNLDVSFRLNNPASTNGGWQMVSLSKLAGALGIIIGAGSGGIIGAIAGDVSARPETRPIPAWFWWTVLGLVLLVVVAGAVLVFWKSSPKQQREDNSPTRLNPGPDDRQKADPPGEQRAPRQP